MMIIKNEQLDMANGEKIRFASWFSEWFDCTCVKDELDSNSNLVGICFYRSKYYSKKMSFKLKQKLRPELQTLWQDPRPRNCDECSPKLFWQPDLKTLFSKSLIFA
jgi:hypothetical protein